MAIKEKFLKPDSKGRITIGNAAKNISRYKALFNENGSIILEPQVEIPACESWLYQNSEVLKKVRKGLKDSANNKTRERGSFSQYADEEIK